MGSEERIKQLEFYHKEDPNDPFPVYALAMEYLYIDKQKSRDLFEILLTNHADYIGTYYHAAALYIELGEKEKAELTYKVGISKAQKAGNHHALRELQSAYQNFLFDDDE
ncbi:MAG: tetratricopeptide repeat protein [Bacteroidota bacterium]